MRWFLAFAAGCTGGRVAIVDSAAPSGGSSSSPSTTGDTAAEAPGCPYAGSYTVDGVRCGTLAADWTSAGPAELVDDPAGDLSCGLVLRDAEGEYPLLVLSVHDYGDWLLVGASDGEDPPPGLSCPSSLIVDLYR